MSNPTNPSTILIFAKTPRAGKVKTRLARSVGHRAAVNIYLQLCQHAIETALATGLAVEIWVSGPLSHPIWLQARRQGCRIRSQVSGDLGRRMLLACLRSQRETKAPSPRTTHNNRAPLILIGCDCPNITPNTLLWAADRLYDNNAVTHQPQIDNSHPQQGEKPAYALQASTDGGYVLLGVRQSYCQLFQRMPWSTPTLTKRTKRAIAQQQAQLHETQITYDVDNIQDWKRYQRQR